MKPNMKQKIKGILILVGIIAVLVSILPLPTPVNKTISGIDFYDGDPEKVSEDQIIIKGVYYRYLFRKNVLKEIFMS